ncbi:MAG: fibronectin type III domain-containing protein, partial [Allobaculum sp.]|nr:fibronectin type III domain-containing protein [Allobaculum sp.]
VTYSIPANAKRVRFCVKPVSKTHEVNKKETVYWTYRYSDWVEYTVPSPEPDTTPKTPNAPTIELTETNKLKMKMTVSGIADTKTKYIGFEVVQDDNKMFYKNVAPKHYQTASMIIDVSPDHRYKVRAKALGKKLNASMSIATDQGAYEIGGLIAVTDVRANSMIASLLVPSWEQAYETISGWSDYSSDITTQPSKVLDPIKIESISTTSVKISWETPVLTATGYTVEYTTNIENFGQSGSQSTSVEISNVVGNFVIVTGLDTGSEWFFRIKATNQSGESEWSSIVSTRLGTVSGPPTTWSSSVTGKIGDDIVLYWIHNSEDGSIETSALLTITYEINGITETKEITIQNNSGTYGSISSYLLNTSGFEYDTVITWHVKTMGFIETYGESSVERMINVYLPPTVSLTFYKQNSWFWDPFNFETDDIYTAKGYFQNPYLGDAVITSFPILIGTKTSPSSQKPIECYISIIAMDTYEGIEYSGESNTIYAGDE